LAQALIQKVGSEAHPFQGVVGVSSLSGRYPFDLEAG
jgi:hypothetical protein